MTVNSSQWFPWINVEGTTQVEMMWISFSNMFNLVQTCCQRPTSHTFLCCTQMTSTTKGKNKKSASTTSRKERNLHVDAYQTCVTRYQNLSSISFGEQHLSAYNRAHCTSTTSLYIHSPSPLVLQICWLTSFGILWNYISYTIYVWVWKSHPPEITMFFHLSAASTRVGLLQLCASLLRAVFVALQFLQPSLFCDRRSGVPQAETARSDFRRENGPFKEDIRLFFNQPWLGKISIL